MIIQEKTSFDNRPLYILSKTNNITQDAIDSYYRPYLEKLKDHANNNGYFYTISKDEVVNGFCKVFASKDLFTIWSKVKSQGKEELFNQIFTANEQQINKAKRKGNIEFI